MPSFFCTIVGAPGAVTEGATNVFEIIEDQDSTEPAEEEEAPS